MLHFPSSESAWKVLQWLCNASRRKLLFIVIQISSLWSFDSPKWNPKRNQQKNINYSINFIIIAVFEYRFHWSDMYSNENFYFNLNCVYLRESNCSLIVFTCIASEFHWRMQWLCCYYFSQFHSQKFLLFLANKNSLNP